MIRISLWAAIQDCRDLNDRHQTGGRDADMILFGHVMLICGIPSGVIFGFTIR